MKPNYRLAKRQREQRKSDRRAEKLERKRAAAAAGTSDDATANPWGEAPAAERPAAAGAEGARERGPAGDRPDPETID